MNTFHKVLQKRNPYQYKNRRRSPEPTPASLLYPPKIYIKENEGSMLVSVCASTVYAV